MLQNLHIKNIALISEIEVEFNNGLNILTGETGAGKSIILGSINLALGGKYSSTMLREGADYGIIELVFSIQNEKQKEKLTQLGVFFEDDTLILSRRFTEGRSISRINGETVGISLVKAVAEILLDIHGQHEHQSLLYKKNHLKFVDEFAKDEISELKIKVKDAYKKNQELQKKLAELDMDSATREKEMAFLEFEVSEIEAAELSLGEDEDLEERYNKMVHSRKIVENCDAAYQIISGDEGTSEQLSNALHLLSGVTGYDVEAEKLAEQLGEVEGLLSDFNHELMRYLDTLEFSEEEYTEVGDRLDVINNLKRKYGKYIEDILEVAEKNNEKLEILKQYDAYIANLTSECETAKDDYLKWAKKLSDKRKKQAKVLENEVSIGVRDLNFEDARFEIKFVQTEKLHENGMDEVEFLIALNPGQPLRPLSEVASGGELSRIMLAIKSVMAEKDDIETLIFDEIDVGISGRTAQKVSEKMAHIAKNHQVICITHLAQIAAMADTHFIIEKAVKAGDTNTYIRPLEATEIPEELARILGGAEITEAVLANAVEMKALASKMKNIDTLS